MRNRKQSKEEVALKGIVMGCIAFACNVTLMTALPEEAKLTVLKMAFDFTINQGVALGIDETESQHIGVYALHTFMNRLTLDKQNELDRMLTLIGFTPEN